MEPSTPPNEPGRSPRFAPVPLAESAGEAARPWPKTKAELRRAYVTTTTTMARWLEPYLPLLFAAGYVKTQRVLTRKQVRIIFENLDPPEGYEMP